MNNTSILLEGLEAAVEVYRSNAEILDSSLTMVTGQLDLLNSISHSVNMVSELVDAERVRVANKQKTMSAAVEVKAVLTDISDAKKSAIVSVDSSNLSATPPFINAISSPIRLCDKCHLDNMPINTSSSALTSTPDAPAAAPASILAAAPNVSADVLADVPADILENVPEDTSADISMDTLAQQPIVESTCNHACGYCENCLPKTNVILQINAVGSVHINDAVLEAASASIKHMTMINGSTIRDTYRQRTIIYTVGANYNIVITAQYCGLFVIIKKLHYISCVDSAGNRIDVCIKQVCDSFVVKQVTVNHAIKCNYAIWLAARFGEYKQYRTYDYLGMRPYKLKFDMINDMIVRMTVYSHGDGKFQYRSE